MKKVMNSLLIALVFISSNGFTMSETIKSLIFTSYDLSPGNALMLVNTLPKTIAVQCVLTVVSSQNHSILIKAISGNGQINGTTLNKGQTMMQTIHNAQVIPITANSGAKAEFTNMGPYSVNASCA